MKERWADIALVWFLMATAIVVIPTIYVLFGGGGDYLDRYDKAVTQTMQPLLERFIVAIVGLVFAGGTARLLAVTVYLFSRS
jgi:hypothetical protein